MLQNNKFFKKILKDMADNPREYERENRLRFVCDVNKEFVRNFLSTVVCSLLGAYSLIGFAILVKQLFRRDI